MTSYYILEWPDSQEFMGVDGCYMIDGEMSVAVPVNIYHDSLKDTHSHTADVDYKL